MLCESHTTISIFRHYVDLWRKREGWSRETVVQNIVEAHEKINGPAITGITFSDHSDTFMRMKVNADRIYRWLDDSGKDTNLIPSNFIPSILSALPDDLKIRCIDDIIRPLGLVVNSISGLEGSEFDRVRHTQSVVKESSEAISAMAIVGPDTPLEALIEVSQELGEAENAVHHAKDDIDVRIANLLKRCP